MMVTSFTEDQIRDRARDILGFHDSDRVSSGVGQITTFNQLGFKGVLDKPDGWWLPKDKSQAAIILETKASTVELGDKQVEELKKNIRIVRSKYNTVIGLLYNGELTRIFIGEDEIDGAKDLQKVEYYLMMLNDEPIDKERIYELTKKINDSLHFNFGVKNLYHRMIFTACALVAKRYDALMVEGMDYSTFHNSILSCLNKELIRAKKQNQKLELLANVFAGIQMNLDVSSEDEKSQERIKDLIWEFIQWVSEISDCLNSDSWRGEDVMGIFFNEFNRYKKKSEAGQVFTPEHITDFMYKILEVNADDRVLDATCGSGGFLIKSMANMVREVGGVSTEKAKSIKSCQLYGIEFDREIYALACANMLIHKDGKTNLEQLDARSSEAGAWIQSKKISKVLMNPPYENKYGCMDIVENVLDNVPSHTTCGFILPDKKLEKVSKKQIGRILSHHRLKKIIKLPEDLFFGIGITTSIFVFEAGVPQNDEEIFGCYMESDGLETVKNKGRHDVRGKWTQIEKHWIQVVKRQSGDESVQWINPSEHLSYQMPEKPFEIFEADFRKAALDYYLFSNDIDAGAFQNRLLNKILYEGTALAYDGGVTIDICDSKSED